MCWERWRSNLTRTKCDEISKSPVRFLCLKRTQSSVLISKLSLWVKIHSR